MEKVIIMMIKEIIMKKLAKFFSIIMEKKDGSLLPTGEIISNEEAKFFLAYILQPLDWRLPVIVIHLVKSITGHHYINKIEDLQKVFSIVCSNNHFKCNFFAADRETELNLLHNKIYLCYESDIKAVIDEDMSLDEFYM